MDLHRDMTYFHAAIAAVIQDHPSIPERETLALRIELITEEVMRELIPALERCKHAAFAEDIRLLADVADGAVDSMVVIIGTLISFGIDFRPIWDEVMRTNFAKATGPIREDGKRLKPAGWEAPDIEALIVEQLL